MKIKAFAESKWHEDKNDPRYSCYVEYEDGTKKIVKEDIIERLWHPWLCSGKGIRQDNNEFTIFAYKEPTDVGL